MEGKMKPAFNFRYSRALIRQKLRIKLWDACQTAKEILHRIGRRNLKLFGPVDGVGSQHIFSNELWLH